MSEGRRQEQGGKERGRKVEPEAGREAGTAPGAPVDRQPKNVEEGIRRLHEATDDTKGTW